MDIRSYSRRRLAEAGEKEGTDLNEERSCTMPTDTEELVSRLRDARTIVALTGAGVSAASRIPTFRGDDGLWRAVPGPRRTSTGCTNAPGRRT